MVTQNAQMAHKVAVVDEVRTRIGDASASIVSEYRGLSVAELAELRIALAAVGGDYRIFKNTLVRRAIDGGDYQPLSEYLSGPSALTFVQGDVSAVAKALKDFARSNPLLVIKGGLADGSLLSSSDLAALAELPSRDVLLARIAGALAAPMQQMAGLLQALPRNLAYGLSALIEQREAGGEKLPEAPAAEAAEAAEADTEAPAEAEAEAPPAAEAEAPPAEAAEAEAPAEAAAAEVEAPATEAAEAEVEAPPAEAAAEVEAEAAPAAEAEAPAEAPEVEAAAAPEEAAAEAAPVEDAAE
jgi:large subunit ribosomal protein L10